MVAQSRKSIKALDVARYFIYISNRENKILTNKKLQKLVYYAQAWSLVLNDKRLFNDPIEAWVHGPAIRSLYGQYKDFGFNPIKEDVTLASLKISKKHREFLDKVWAVYGKLDAGYLEMLTHSEKPWQEAREGLQNDQKSGNEISLAAMKSFYSAKLVQTKKHK